MGRGMGSGMCLLWLLLSMDMALVQSNIIPESGSADIPVSVPDTMTELSAQMFGAGPRGLGLSSPLSLQNLQPFFIDVTFPNSVKRGETPTLTASVFNTMSEPMKVTASMPSSDQFQINNSKTSENSFCLPGGANRTLSWDITPKTIGQMHFTVIAEAVKSGELCGEQETVIPKKGSRHVVIGSMLVVPEGTVVEQTHNSLLISDGNSVSEKVKFELPSSYVPGSEKAFISVCGDIMAPSLSNIGNLLQMPYGSGERIMILFAPNVYILQYLKTSDQLNPTVLAKGKDMLEKGYAQQLMYQHQDGSYSAFGMSDPEGSTWLTASVLKSFSQAREFISIDDEVMKQGMEWLKAQQKPNGCFKTTGRLIQNGIEGGMDDEVTLSTYITIALLESGTDPSDPMVEKALECMEKESLEDASPYKMTLMAYAYTLAKMEDNRAAVMKKLNEQDTKADSNWSKPKSEEMAEINQRLLQRNSSGGFSSSQGGMDDEVTLSTYITIALLDSGTDPSDPMVQKGLKMMEKESLEDASPYKLTLMAYAYTLAKMEDNRAAVMKKLNQQDTKADSNWSKPKSGEMGELNQQLLQRNPNVDFNSSQGGMDDKVPLSAYITISLLEYGTDPSDPMVQKGLKMMEKQSLEDASPYKLTLMAYAYTLAKMEDKRAAVMKKLNQQDTKADSNWSRPKSVDVEMKAYTLLSLASTEKPTKEELGDMAEISQWLIKKQNPHGGFSNTQDTVVALQALSRYARLIPSKAGAVTVDMTTENGFHHRFQVNNDNRLLLQKVQLPQIPGECTVTVSGTGSVIMQAVQQHNILPNAKEHSFFLSAKPQYLKNDLIKISLEFRYTGKRQSTNTALVEIDMLSGFEPDSESADKLMENPMVRKVEMEADSVTIYLQEVTSKPQTLELLAKQTVPVSGLKPAIIKIYDYDMPEESHTISYERGY